MSSSITSASEHYCRFHGWATSLAIHSLAGGLILLMADRLTPPRTPEPFRWNVVVQASPSSDSTATAPAEPKVAPPPSPPVANTRLVPTRNTAHVPAVQQSLPRLDLQPVIREQAEETRPVEYSTRNVIEQAVRTPSPTVVERRAEPQNRPVERKNQMPMVETVPSHLIERPVERTPAQDAPTKEEIPPAQHAEIDSSHATETHPVVHDIGRLAEREAVIEQVVSLPEAVPSQSSPVMTKELVKSIESTPVEPRIVTEQNSTPLHEENTLRATTEIAKLQPSLNKPTPQAFATPQADYGWLVQVLRSKVQELKRYPAIARMNNWEGRVVLRAVIKDNGEVAQLDVAESSGHAALDSAALDAMRRASPLKLPHPLGRSHVVLYVPIRYHLR